MIDRKIWIRALLASVALGAAIGVVMVLSGDVEVFYTMLASVCVIAVASALMLGATMMIERPTTHASGIVAALLIASLTVVSFGMIWVPDYWGYFGDRFFMTNGALLLAGLPAMAIARLLHTDHSRLAGRIGLYLAIATLGFCLAGTWWPVTQSYGYGGYSPDGAKLWATGSSVGLVGLLAVGCLIALRRPMDRPWRWVGVIAAVGAATMMTFKIWWPDYTWRPHHGDGGYFGVLVSIAAVCCQANVLVSLSLPKRFRWLLRATIYTGIATATVFSTLVLTELVEYFIDTWIARLVAAGVLLSVCGTVALLFLAYFSRPTPRTLPRAEFTTVDVICPLCSRRQPLAVGQTTGCPGCGLWMQVNIAEPRCASCDYLLYHVQGSNCPECGQPIDAKPAFAGAITSTNLGA